MRLLQLNGSHEMGLRIFVAVVPLRQALDDSGW